MPVSISFNCEIPQSQIDGFVKALADYQRKTQRDMREALRSATIDLVKSLRKQTRKSKKFIERAEIFKSWLAPKWIRRGHSGEPLRRMALHRWGKDSDWFDHRYVYGGRFVRGPKGGQRVRPYSEAQMVREARKNYGRIRNWGLAKKSWGWFMKAMFHKSMQDENPKAVLTRRMVGGGITEKRAPLPDGTMDMSAPIRCDIDIVNRLDYIRKSMPPGALEIALQKATRLITKKAQQGFQSRRFGK